MSVTPLRDIGRDMSRPDPLSAADCDLRGMEWMPLQTQDLLDSDLYLFSTGDEFKAAVTLICRSWRQVPAGSLPNDDHALATLSGARDWTSVRTMALRNWVLCSDGRLYHPIVARKAMEALPHRQEFVEKKTAENDRKARERKDRKDLFAKLREAGIVLPATTKTTELRERVAQLQPGPVTPAVTPPVTPPVTPNNRDMSQLGQGPDTTPQGQSSSTNTSDMVGASCPPAGDQVEPAGDGGKPFELTQGDETPDERVPLPACPHLDILKLWAEVLPAMPQHDPDHWNPTRRSNLQARWREKAAKLGWKSKDDGLRYFRRLFAYVGQSQFLTGRAAQRDPNRRPFVIELEWLILPSNWAKVLEGKYHTET